MTEPDITAFIRTLVGKKLESFCCEADILDFGFSDDLVLHAMGCTRVVRGSDILLTTCDINRGMERSARTTTNGGI